MLYLLLAAGVVALLVWAGRRSPGLNRADIRIVAGLVALLALGGAIFVTLRGQYLGGAVLLALGAWLAPQARPPRRSPEGGEAMSLAEARSILGVGPEATRGEIQEAYRRLMRVTHPDKGGTHGLAAKLNAARQRLLDG